MRLRRRVFFNEKQGGWMLQFFLPPFVEFIQLDPIAARRGQQIDNKEDAERVSRTVPTPYRFRQSGRASHPAAHGKA